MAIDAIFAVLELAVNALPAADGIADLWRDGLQWLPAETRPKVLDGLVLAALWDDGRVDAREHAFLLERLQTLELAKNGDPAQARAALEASFQRVSAIRDAQQAWDALEELAKLLTADKDRRAFALTLALIERGRSHDRSGTFILDTIANFWSWDAEKLAKTRAEAAKLDEQRQARS